MHVYISRSLSQKNVQFWKGYEWNIRQCVIGPKLRRQLSSTTLITLSDILLRRGKKQLQKQHQNETCCHIFGNGFHFELSDNQHFSVYSRQDKKIFFKKISIIFFLPSKFQLDILRRFDHFDVMDIEAILTKKTSEIGVQDITEMVWAEADWDFQAKDVIFVKVMLLLTPITQ